MLGKGRTQSFIDMEEMKEMIRKFTRREKEKKYLVWIGLLTGFITAVIGWIIWMNVSKNKELEACDDDFEEDFENCGCGCGCGCDEEDEEDEEEKEELANELEVYMQTELEDGEQITQE